MRAYDVVRAVCGRFEGMGVSRMRIAKIVEACMLELDSLYLESRTKGNVSRIRMFSRLLNACERITYKYQETLACGMCHGTSRRHDVCRLADCRLYECNMGIGMYP